MDRSMFFWYAMVGCVILVFIVRLIGYIRSSRVEKGSDDGKGSLFSMIKERDMFYMPGDNRFDDDDDDFDDL